MTTTTPATPANPTPQPPASGRGSGARAITIVAIVLGSLVLLSTLTSAVFSTIASATERTTVRSIATTGVDSLDVRVGGGSLRVEFSDVREAELEVTGAWGADRWTLERRDDRLVVTTPNRFGTWIGDWLTWGDDRDRSSGVLRLPASLAGADAELELSAGELIVAGDFDDLDLEVSAGRLEASGSATELSARVSAGRGDLDLSGVEEATFSVSAGTIESRLSGAQPESVEATVSAGSLHLWVPEGDYAVTSDVSAGGFDNRIGSDPRATSRINVDVSAGQVVLRSDG